MGYKDSLDVNIRKEFTKKVMIIGRFIGYAFFENLICDHIPLQI